jgi:hypothetical protein
LAEKKENPITEQSTPSSEPITTPDVKTIGWREFLTDRPVGTRACVDVATRESRVTAEYITISLPDLELQCDGNCQCLSYCKGSKKNTGKLFCGIGDDTYGRPSTPCDAVLWYSCEKCDKCVKSYVVRFWSMNDVQKIAEWPPFAPRTPSKAISLVGPDRDLFLKGRKAEIEGLGIGAFTYYRRIIENQKNRFLDEIIRVARRLGMSDDTISELESAKAETQFSNAVEKVKTAIPEVLYIKGYNPFTLLHNALSDGVHNISDETCLVAASDIRLILFQFVEKLTEAMKDQRELDEAVNRLANRRG